MSVVTAPISDIRIYPVIPNVEGKRCDSVFHINGILCTGHDKPDMKSKGIDMKTNTSMSDSLSRDNMDNVMLKKTHAVIYIDMNGNNVFHCQI